MSKTVDDLVEKVARAMAGDDDIVGHKDGPLGWMYYRQPACAAIAAVAEWMIDEFSYQAEMIEIKQAIAAALRAAAGSALEAKP